MAAPPPPPPQPFPPSAIVGPPHPPLPSAIVPPTSQLPTLANIPTPSSLSSSSITTLSKLNATTVILTHIPPFLRHPKNLRDLLFYSTSTTTIKHLFYSCPIKRFANDVNIKQDNNDKVVAVIKFTHAGNALSISRNWKFVQQKLNQQLQQSKPNNDDSNYDSLSDCKMNAFLLYSDTSNNLTQLHPEKSKVDANFIESIWELIHKERDNSTDAGKVAQQADLNMIHSLVESYRMIERRQKELDNAAVQDGTTPETDFDTNVNDSKEVNEDIGGNTASTNTDSSFKLDSAKLRAAAGGGAYDEENDPLNAPEVLEAVKQFKKRLEITQGGFRRKRKEYVDKRLENLVKPIKEKLREQRRIEKEEREKLSLLPPPPPLPMGLMPPPPPSLMNLPTPIPLPPSSGTLPPVDGNVAVAGAPNNNNIPSRETGRRGVSNLPAWMTAVDKNNNDGKKRSFDEATNGNYDNAENSNNEPTRKKTFTPSEANRDINIRKERLDVNEGATSLAAIRAANEAADKKAKEDEEEQEKVLQYYKDASTFTNEQILKGKYPKIYISEKIPTIRDFVKEQMVEYLGEEEATLIDFVMNYIVKCNGDGSSSNDGKGKSVQGLLGEMEVVLDEDAETFVIDLFKKILDV